MAVARELGDVDLVSVDSMQVYRGMDIGTAKPSTSDRAEVRHHLLDLVDPTEEFTVARVPPRLRRGPRDDRFRGSAGAARRRDRAVPPRRRRRVRPARPVARATGEVGGRARTPATLFARADPTRPGGRREDGAVESSARRPGARGHPGQWAPVQFVRAGRRRVSRPPRSPRSGSGGPGTYSRERIAARVHEMVTGGLFDEVAGIEAPGRILANGRPGARVQGNSRRAGGPDEQR